MENIVIFAVISVVIIICVFFVILFKIKKRINSSKDLLNKLLGLGRELELLKLDILKVENKKKSMAIEYERYKREDFKYEIAISILQSKLKEFGNKKSKQSELN